MKNPISPVLKTIFLYFLISPFSCISLYAQSGWYQVSAPGNDALRGIYFRDVNNGIIREYKTSNGGQNWINTNGGYGYSLSFPDMNTGYAAGIYYLSKTTNFGVNWILLPIPDSVAFYGVTFPNTNTGFICGTSTKIFKTTNSGSNWIALSPQFPNYIIFYGISFLDTSLGFVVGSSIFRDTNMILKTTNHGIYWDINYFNNYGNGYLQSIFMINANTGIVGGASLLFKTTNSGLMWEYRPTPTSNVINSIFFPSANTGYGVCTYGDIIKTTDGGNTWFKQTPVTGNNLYTVFFVNDYTGYACGDNGTVLKTTDGGGPPIGIKPIGKEIPKTFSLSQNYPNPFNPTTKIRYQIPNSSFVKISVFDILGREVAVLINEKQNPGTYEVDFDGSAFPSGVYFYRIVSGSYTETKKMILIK